MRRSRAATKLVVSGLALAIFGFGCSLIVSGDLSEVRCSGTDPSACPNGMACNASGVCVSGDAGIVPVEAGKEDGPFEDVVVDAARDADAGPQDLGSKCRVDNDCRSRLCGSSTILTTTIAPPATGPICTTPCCTSGECAPSFVCFNGGTGGGYCVPAATAQRMPPASGGKIGGATCATNNECRSGLCDKPDGGTARCFDTCCTDSECSSTGTVLCRIKSVSAPGPLHDVFVCATPEPGAAKGPGAACGGNFECLNDNCVGVPRNCQPPCASTATCKTIAGFSDGHCLYGSSTGDNFRFCKQLTSGALLAKGAACGDNLSCQSDYCDKELGKCLNVCGRDSDCATNESCRPSATNTPYLRCVPKP